MHYNCIFAFSGKALGTILTIHALKMSSGNSSLVSMRWVCRAQKVLRVHNTSKRRYYSESVSPLDSTVICRQDARAGSTKTRPRDFR